MSDDQHHLDGDMPGTVHLHSLGAQDDLQRLRITLTCALLAMYDDWPSTLARDLFMDALHQVTIMCKIEVTADDEW